MTQTALPPMTPGGEWLHDGSHHAPLYVVHEAHIKRLLSEGWRPTHDPRQPETKPVDTSKEADLAAQLAAALERIKALEAQSGEESPESTEQAKSGRKAKG